jgi:ribA/ribD-fused uncharacterized protein
MTSTQVENSVQPVQDSLNSVPPIFIKDRDIRSIHISALDICKEVIKITGTRSLEGVQKVNNLWRIYVKDLGSRVKLYMREKLNLGGKQVPLYDANPFTSRLNTPREPNDKLTIKNVPLSVSNDQFTLMLNEKDIELRSDVRFGYLRELDGGLTSFKSGDRYVYVKPYDVPLPKDLQVGTFPCMVIHHGKMSPCIACSRTGHKIGEDICIAKPTQEIYSFKGFNHPLSNHFPCDLEIYETRFSSIEHAFLWRMATEMGKPELARKIKDSAHAGIAKKLSNELDDEARYNWESNNMDTMKELLAEKVKQCQRFKNCLVENCSKTLAEASGAMGNNFWTTGLSPYASQNTDPSFWPGKNMMGALLMELTQKIMQETDSPTDMASNVQTEINQTAPTQTGTAETETAETETNQTAPAQTETAETEATGKETNQEKPSQTETTEKETTQIEPDETEPTHTENSQTEIAHSEPAATDTRSRPKEKTPPSARQPRSMSLATPIRRSEGNTNRDRKKPTKKTDQTPNTMDIRAAFNAKRKEFDSSPQDKGNEAKHAKTQVKQDSVVK